MMPSILVVSHERSGTHYLINTIAKNFGYSMREESILGEPDDLYKKICGLSGAEIIIKGHHQYQWFEPHFQDILKRVRVIYISRGGKDVLTSCFHYMHKNRDTGSFPETVNHGKPDFGYFIRQDPAVCNFDGWYSKDKSSNMPQRWAKHVAGWEYRHGVLDLTYEELKGDFDNVVTDRIAPHLGIPLEVAEPIEPTIRDRGVDNRVGVVGDHKNIFSETDYEFYQREVDKVFS